MVWTSQASLSTARAELAGGGSPSDAICMGGEISGNPDVSAVTEEWNGTAWSSGGNLGTARRAPTGGGGSSNAICMGGEGANGYLSSTEEYNGTSWSAGGTIDAARKYMGGGGNSANAICMGGFYYEEDPEEITDIYDDTEEYNGTAWSSGGNLGTARYGLAAGGNSSGSICMGGYVDDSPYYSALTEEYNGTAWSSGGNLGTAREGPAGGGSATEAVCFGGFSGSPLANTEIYDGSAWSSSDNMSTARYYLAGGGAPDGAIGMGGTTTGSFSTVTETFIDAPPVPRTMVIWI